MQTVTDSIAEQKISEVHFPCIFSIDISNANLDLKETNQLHRYSHFIKHTSSLWTLSKVFYFWKPTALLF